MSPSVDLTLLVCTYNRAQDLKQLLTTTVNQRTNGVFAYEVIVVDNNSSDSTRSVTLGFTEQFPSLVRYLFEPAQGKSYALNTGLSAIRSRYYAIVDDDFLLPPDWVMNIADAFRRHPGAAFIGGKVLPHWEAPPPEWLTEHHWSALGLANYGDKEFVADAARGVCLLACVFQVEAVQRVGGYNTLLGVSGSKIGGVEDLDIIQRLWQAGSYGMYLPAIELSHRVAPARLQKPYHRRWHRGHGASYADLRDPEVEMSRAHILGVPVHLLRQLVTSYLRSLVFRAVGAESSSFMELSKVEFAAGFIKRRLSTHFQPRKV